MSEIGRLRGEEERGGGKGEGDERWSGRMKWWWSVQCQRSEMYWSSINEIISMRNNIL